MKTITTDRFLLITEAMAFLGFRIGQINEELPTHDRNTLEYWRLKGELDRRKYGVSRLREIIKNCEIVEVETEEQNV